MEKSKQSELSDSDLEQVVAGKGILLAKELVGGPVTVLGRALAVAK